MIYRVYSSYNENKETIAICKSRKNAEKYVKYLEKKNKESQKSFYSIRRAFTYYDIDLILEDDDILKLI